MTSTRQYFARLAPVVIVAILGVVVPHLRRQTVTHFLCIDSASNGTSCEVCTSKFKNCRGQYVYEPFTVILFESFLTIICGSCVSLLSSTSIREALGHLLDPSALKAVGFVGAIYALGDFCDILAAGKVNGTTLLVAAQFRLPLCAALRIAILGKGQTQLQWFILSLLFCLCLFHLIGEVSPDSKKQPASDEGLIPILLLCSGKSIISVLSAIQAEWFMRDGVRKQDDSAKMTPTIVKQVHFKTATLLGAIVFGILQGRRGGRILATEWRTGLFDRLPAGVNYGDPRTPFFGGWDRYTWTLVVCLVLNNFIMGYMLKYLTAVSKYTAGGLALVLSYSGQLLLGERSFDVLHALGCLGIAYSTIHYSHLEEEQKKREAEQARAKVEKSN